MSPADAFATALNGWLDEIERAASKPSADPTEVRNAIVGARAELQHWQADPAGELAHRLAALAPPEDIVADLVRVSKGVLADMLSVAPQYRAQQSIDELAAALVPFGGAA